MTPASSVSLLLNLEGVLTALLAWFVFKETTVAGKAKWEITCIRRLRI